MEEILRKFIQEELYEVVDMVIAKQYDPEKKIDSDLLESKSRKLEDLVIRNKPSEDLPEYRQAMFIISNAYRYL
jgi:hypothetical protein